MTTNLIKTTGRPMPAVCFDVPAATLSSLASGFGGFGGSDLSSVSISVDATRVEGGLATWTTMRDERPTSASVAAVAANRGYAYAAGAEKPQQHEQQAEHLAMRAFRGPEPWRERT